VSAQRACESPPIRRTTTTLTVVSAICPVRRASSSSTARAWPIAETAARRSPFSRASPSRASAADLSISAWANRTSSPGSPRPPRWPVAKVVGRWEAAVPADARLRKGVKRRYASIWTPADKGGIDEVAIGMGADRAPARHGGTTVMLTPLVIGVVIQSLGPAARQVCCGVGEAPGSARSAATSIVASEASASASASSEAYCDTDFFRPAALADVPTAHRPLSEQDRQTVDQAPLDGSGRRRDGGPRNRTQLVSRRRPASQCRSPAGRS